MRPTCLAILFVFHVSAALAPGAFAQDDDDEPEYRPGLVAHYTDAHGQSIIRQDADVAFVWGNRAPDSRLANGAFTVRWEGRLFSIVPGSYQLHLHAAGKVRLLLEDQVLLDAQSPQSAWLEAKPIELTYGYHRLTIEYAPSPDDAKIGLYWSGPQFQLEPVPARHLFHLPADSPSRVFEQGQLLVRALRCEGCHELPHSSTALTAPALDRVRGNLQPSWIVDWLSAKSETHEEDPAKAVTDVPRRMPHFDLSPKDAEAITSYLMSVSHESPSPVKFNASMVPEPPPSKDGKKTKKKPRTKPSATEGQRLVNTLGCLACHRLEQRGVQALFGGGDLTNIALKRPDDFFAQWLTDPKQVNRAHRMPVFKLEAIEWADLSAYLETLKPSAAKEKPKKVSDDRATVERGRDLVREHRCGACHQLGEESPSSLVRSRLSDKSRWDESCLGAPTTEKHRPGYALTAAQRGAVRRYVLDVKPQPHARLDGSYVLAERNCLGCHARDLSLGITERLDAVVAADPELATLLPALSPPSLSGVGDKLHDEALESAILLKRPPLRPWLSIRMPRFDLSSDEMLAVESFFINHDRIPDLPTPTASQGDDQAQALAARRLVTADGFGCTSCHKIGDAEPQKVALNAHGTDLTMLGERVRQPWYDRWVRNPARIVPRMEMPAIQQPVRGVLGDDVNKQLAALWKTLNTPGFNPPPPGPVRIVRSRNVPEIKERANVITDVFEVGDDVFIRPVVIGLPNRHNVMFDLVSGRLAQWWVGDTAAERTRGKAWYWTIGGDPLFKNQGNASEFALELSEQRHQATAQGQTVALLDSIDHSEGVELRARWRFATPGGERALTIVQSFEPTDGGFLRHVRCEDLASGERLVMTPAPRSSERQGVASARALSVTVRSSENSTPQDANEVMFADANRTTLLYSTRLPIDQFPVQVPPLPNMPARTLSVMPGWETTQLSLPTEEMPTGFDWRKDGTLVMSSLKGRACVATDSDGDGLEDTLKAVSDDLATPYGIAANDDNTLDVICKYGVVRLHDANGDGFCERSEIVADGWGMTNDYHDWAVGLPRDSQGNYVIALPCQQDDRDEAAARLRGQALRLIPREPTSDNPRRFKMEPISAGLRFPMGIAINGDGAIFASDNQGNYNPYNEINHLIPGKRYGFINKLEVSPDFKPPLESPAVELPHPWTRSVNGLCFLATPKAVREKLGRDLFGPFEGHLVGCEYTTLRLIRMTVDKVGDTYQGAAYPMSVVPSANEPTLEGPVVAAVAPDGDVYVGNMRDSGWGGGQNTGSIVRMRMTDNVPIGIRHVRATSDGFEIEFTGSIDDKQAKQSKRYSILSYRRISTPAYGGENIDERAERVKKVDVSPDGNRVALHLDTMRAGHVYEIRVDIAAADGRPLFPAEAYYTLRVVP